MEALITRYGLPAVFVGAAIEGDMVVILSGVAAHLQLLSFPAALATGWLGAVVADCVWYTIGRCRSAQARQTKAYRLVGPRIEELGGRLGAGEIVIARFIFGTRVVSMLFWGIHELPFARFAALDVLGCAIWATALMSLGYGFSGSAAVLVGDVKRVEYWLAVALVVATAATVAARRLLRRSLAQRRATR
jgi:membrane protein DedA with SNARE-associated domain